MSRTEVEVLKACCRKGDPLPDPEELAEWLQQDDGLPREAMAEYTRCWEAMEAAGLPDWAGTFRGGSIHPAELIEASLLGRLEQAYLEAYQGVPKENRGSFPFVPLVRAYLRRPTDVEPNRRADRIVPARLAMCNDSRAPKYFSPAAHVDPSGQEVLPGFAVRPAPPAAWPLELFRMGGGSDSAKGRGIALPLRLFLEAVLAVPKAERNGQPRTLNITLKELTDWLYPNGLPGGNRKALYDRLDRASLALFNTRVPIFDMDTGRHEIRSPVLINGIPRGPEAMTDNVRIIVDLPRDSERGPVVPAALRSLATNDADAWRLLLNLTFFWYRPGVTDRPLGRRADGKGKFWGKSSNPDHYRPVDDDDLVAMTNPISKIRQRRVRLHHARAALERLKEAGEVQVVVEGRTRLILPPGKM